MPHDEIDGVGDRDGPLYDRNHDCGGEALATLNLVEFFDWSGVNGQVPVVLADVLTVTADCGPLIVDADPVTGTVRHAATTAECDHQFELRAEWQLVPTDEPWFLADG